MTSPAAVRIDFVSEQLFMQRGIRSVPATIINGQYLISGGQPVDTFEQALRQAIAKA